MKGFSSSLGVVSAISADIGKVLDVWIMSKSCEGCTQIKSLQKSDVVKYNNWKEQHV